MPSKQPKESQGEVPPSGLASSTPPPYRGTSAGYDFYLQSIVEIQKSVGGIESSIKHLCERDQSHDAKLESVSAEVHGLSKEVHGAKKLAWIFGTICSVIGAVGLVFLNKILDVVVAYATVKMQGH